MALKTKDSALQSTKKRSYVSPKIETFYIACESSIAAGSARVTPVNENSQVLVEDWENGDGVSEDFLWD